MRIYDNLSNVTINYEEAENGYIFSVYVRRIEFDDEFIASCAEFLKLAFNLDIQGKYRDKNEYCECELILSQVRRSQAYDLAFTVTVYDIKNPEKMRDVMYECLNKDNYEKKELHCRATLINDNEYVEFLEEVMNLEDPINPFDECPSPEDIIETEDGVTIIAKPKELEINDAEIVTLEDGSVFAKFTIGHDIVMQRIV